MAEAPIPPALWRILIAVAVVAACGTASLRGGFLRIDYYVGVLLVTVS